MFFGQQGIKVVWIRQLGMKKGGKKKEKHEEKERRGKISHAIVS